MLYEPGNARSERQRDEMRALERSGVCLFCPDHIRPAALRWSAGGWSALDNQYPYRGTRAHVLLVPDEHVSRLEHLTPRARDRFWVALDRLLGELADPDYGLVVRNGNPRRTGGTVAHLHVHVIVGDVHDPAHEAVRVKVTSRDSRQSAGVS